MKKIIAVYLYDINSGGAEKIMLSYTSFLMMRNDVKVILILSNTNGEYIHLIPKELETIVLNRYSIFTSIGPLIKVLKKNKVEVLYTTLINQNIISILIGKWIGVKVIIREATTYKEARKQNQSYKNKLRYIIAKIVYPFCYRCIAISDAVKNDLLNYTNLKENQIEVIYNPIIIIDDLYHITLDTTRFNIGFVSRLTYLKNLDGIVKIIKIIMAKSSNIVFHFFGVGEYLDNLIQLKSMYPKNVEIHGFNLSYYSYIKRMNLFIHIPFWEGLGNSVLEVYQSGIPMVLSNIDSGFSELIKESVYNNIHYVFPDDTAEIAQLIMKYSNGEIQINKERVNLSLSPDLVYSLYYNLAKG